MQLGASIQELDPPILSSSRFGRVEASQRPVHVLDSETDVRTVGRQGGLEEANGLTAQLSLGQTVSISLLIAGIATVQTGRATKRDRPATKHARVGGWVERQGAQRPPARTRGASIRTILAPRGPLDGAAAFRAFEPHSL